MGKVINIQMDEDFYNEIIQGGGSGSGEASTIEYLDVSGMSYEKMDLIFNSYLVRFIYDNKVQVVGGASLITIGDIESALMGVVAVAIDFNSLIIKGGDEIDTVLEDLIHSFTQEQLDSIPRLTKEQFYSLE